MHANFDINVRLSISIEETKTVAVATLADAVTDEDLEATVLEELVQCLDAQLVEEYCGEKHVRGNGDRRFQRAGTGSRTATTTAGEHDFDLSYVHDTADGTYFRPIEDVLTFDGQNHYQEDLGFAAAKAATKLSYRDAAQQLAEFTTGISRSTIHRRVKRFGGQLRAFLHDEIAGTQAETVMADGTKCHSQQDEISFHDVNIILNRDVVDADGETTLLDVTVDGAWSDTATALRADEAIAEDAHLVSDAEEALVDAFCDDDRTRHQLDLVHLPRTVRYYLWDDAVFDLDERKAIVAEVGADVFHLKNSVEKHRPPEEFDAIEYRIDRTIDRIDRLVRQLEHLDSPQPAQYLRTWKPSVLRFARLATGGETVPWTSNAVERAMGEVSKRCKNQWMRWSAPGLEAMLTLNLVSYANPTQFDAFANDVLGRSTATAITVEVSVCANSGEL